MRIYLNGEETQLADGSKVADLVQVLGLEGQRIAIEVNEELVPRSAFAGHALQTDDAVEIVNAIGGG